MKPKAFFIISSVTPILAGISIAVATSSTRNHSSKQDLSTSTDYWPRDVVVITQPIPNGEGCACDGPIDLPLDLTVPTGIQFTGNCTSGGCAFVPSGSVSYPYDLPIPAGWCADGVTVHMKTNAPIVICTENSQCPTSFFPSTGIEVRAHLIPCDGEEVGEGEVSGEQTNCGGCHL